MVVDAFNEIAWLYTQVNAGQGVFSPVFAYEEPEDLLSKAELGEKLRNPGKTWVEDGAVKDLPLAKHPDLTPQSYAEQRLRPAPVKDFAELADGIKDKCGGYLRNSKGFTSIAEVQQKNFMMATDGQGLLTITNHSFPAPRGAFKLDDKFIERRFRRVHVMPAEIRHARVIGIAVIVGQIAKGALNRRADYAALGACPQDRYFHLRNNRLFIVNWSPAGAEPAPGSTYYCTYDYMTNVEPLDPDYDGFSVGGVDFDRMRPVTGFTKYVCYGDDNRQSTGCLSYNAVLYGQGYWSGTPPTPGGTYRACGIGAGRINKL
jgi:hypothetical protein